MSKFSKIITALKRHVGYGGKRWEVALCCEKGNLNAPFRPPDYDKWDGDIDKLSNYMRYLRPVVYLECWIYGTEELEDNVYVWLDSEKSARVQVCGSKKVETITIQ